jgi:hypothetical protein
MKRLQSLSLSSSLFLLVLLCCVCNGQVAKKTPAPNTKPFGLRIGGEFKLPECLHRFVPKPAYAPGQTQWCWEETSFTPKGSASAPSQPRGEILIRFPASETPTLTISPALTGKVEDGKLQSITFITNGVRAVGDTMEGLSSMFGKPTREEPVTVENNVGNEFQSKNASWEFSNLVVDYRGVDGDLSRGTVWIETPLAHAERIKAGKKAAEKTK